jgi:hypothetical protein
MMSRRTIGILLLLAGCEGLGLMSGQWFFGIFSKTVPPAMITDFNRATAHALFLWRGLIAGFIFFLWSFLAVSLAPFFRKPAESGTEKACPY